MSNIDKLAAMKIEVSSDVFSIQFEYCYNNVSDCVN